MTLVGLYSDLLDRRKSELNSESGYNFTKNMVKSTSILVSLVIGWNEIHNETLRYKSSSNILSFVDNLGYLYSQELPCRDTNVILASNKIEMIIRNSLQINQSICFYHAEDSICFPKFAFNFQYLNCSNFVSSSFSLRNEKSDMFPTDMGEEKDGQKNVLNNKLISLSVNNQSVNGNNLDGPIKISLEHVDTKVNFLYVKTEPSLNLMSQMDRSCVWWDDVGLNWSTRGCETIKEGSTSTVCLCDHLTNFAIMFGEADPHHPILDPLSVVLLSASCLSILVTQAALAITRFAILDNMMSIN